MDNDKNELQYVMNLLKNSPSKEISKEYSAFSVNKKWQFNIKPVSKFDTFNKNNGFNGFLNNKILNTIQHNEIIRRSEEKKAKRRHYPEIHQSSGEHSR